MNLYKSQPISRRDPLALAEGVTVQGPAVARAASCNGGWLDIGVSSSNSSGANSGDATTGDFLVGSNKTPVWVWLIAAAVVVLFLIRKAR